MKVKVMARCRNCGQVYTAQTLAVASVISIRVAREIGEIALHECGQLMVGVADVIALEEVDEEETDPHGW